MAKKYFSVFNNGIEDLYVKDDEVRSQLRATESVTGTSVSKQISPNVFYSFGALTSLTITLGTLVSGKVNEYAFEFDSGSTATTINFPNTITWQETPTIAANKHYEVNIRYDASTTKYYGLIAEWANS